MGRETRWCREARDIFANAGLKKFSDALASHYTLCIHAQFLADGPISKMNKNQMQIAIKELQDAHEPFPVLMQRAIELARRGEGLVEPNPMVGCVVARDGRIVGEGWHQRFGGPHAEIEALRQAGDAARGGTLYVTLEPCCHHGKTPPCTEAILAAGIRSVVAAQMC